MITAMMMTLLLENQYDEACDNINIDIIGGDVIVLLN